jgi:hypothetical protein
MSRGPGHVQRAIRALFDANPDTAFTTEEIAAAAFAARVLAGGAYTVEEIAAAGPGWADRSGCVAALRAVRRVLAGDPDWRARRLTRRCGWVFYNAASFSSTLFSMHWRRRPRPTGQWHATKSMQEALTSGDPWAVRERECAAAEVQRHIAERDAPTPEERARRAAEHAQEREQQQAEQNAAMGTRILRALKRCPPCTRADEGQHLATKARVLLTENDPDAIRAGLIEIAEALEAWGGQP